LLTLNNFLLFENVDNTWKSCNIEINIETLKTLNQIQCWHFEKHWHCIEFQCSFFWHRKHWIEINVNVDADPYSIPFSRVYFLSQMTESSLLVIFRCVLRDHPLTFSCKQTSQVKIINFQSILLLVSCEPLCVPGR